MNQTTDKNVITYQELCMTVPPWFPRGHWPLVEFPLMTLQLQMILIFCVTQAIHRLFFKPLSIPPLLSQLLAGILLSPTAANGGVFTKVRDLIFPPGSEEVTSTISMLGFGLSLFMSSVKMDFSVIRRTGKKPIMLGLSSVALALLTTTMFVTFVVKAFDLHPQEQRHIVSDFTSITSLMSLITFPVITELLTDLNLLNSELGRLAVSAGIVAEILSITTHMASKNVSTLIQVQSDDKTKTKENAKNVLLLVSLVIAVFPLRYLLKWMIKGTPKGRPVHERYLLFVFALGLAGGLVTEYGGQYVLLGIFVVGAAVPEGPPLGSGIIDKFDFIVSDMLQPFFITTSAMKANVLDVQLRGIQPIVRQLLVASTFAIKTIVCVLFGFIFNMALSDTLALSAIMSAKGFVDVGNYVMFLQSELIEEETYTYLILVTTIAAFVVPLAVKHFYNPLRKYAGYEKRCIMQSKDNDDDDGDPHLRVVACVSRPDNVSAITNLLALSSPSKANPMIVNVLHLIRLSGRAQPIFVSHDLQRTKSTDQFEDIIWAFNTFKQTYSSEALSMNFFTIVSPPKAMHEDVCTLALDKMASLLILPFHRKLNIDGHIDLEDHYQRALNKSVLELGPCSIGILVDRGNKKLANSSFRRSETSLTSIEVQSVDEVDEEDVILNVGVIFIGGKDDQEAVSYGKRIANKAVKVQVIRLVALEEGSQISMADCWVLEGTRERNINGFNTHIRYVEQTVKDGPETVKYLWSIVENYDLIIVGRRVGEQEGGVCPQTSGLQGWSEIPELGILGDVLAQPDLKCRTSLLVVQQQLRWSSTKNDFSFRSTF